MSWQGFNIDDHPAFLEDLVHTVRTHLPSQSNPRPAPLQINSYAPTTESLLKRAYLFMEDRDFEQARSYINRVLDMNPECASAYVAMVCVDCSISEESALADIPYSYADNPNWKRALRFAGIEQRHVYEGYIAKAKEQSTTAAQKEHDIPLLATVPKSVPASKSTATGGRKIIDVKQSGNYEYNIYSDGTAEIKKYSGKERYVSIPSDFEGCRVISIGNNAFQACAMAFSITIPDSITSIGERAFSGCTRLRDINIPDSLISIGDFAFHNCTGLSFIRLRDSVSFIGENAFQGCDKLSIASARNSYAASYAKKHGIHLSVLRCWGEYSPHPRYGSQK